MDMIQNARIIKMETSVCPKKESMLIECKISFKYWIIKKCIRMSEDHST